jgi:hypothetical protein
MAKTQTGIFSFGMVAAMLVILAWPLSALAAGTKPSAKTEPSKPADISNAVTQSYNAGEGVQLGMIVKLKEKDAKTVVPLPAKESDKMLGVVIPSGNATFVLTPQTVTNQQVLVTNSGSYTMVVSNQNGPIKVGDYIMISAIDGVGTKADESSDTQVVGKAAGAFTGQANVIGEVELKDTLGRKTKVSLGRIPIEIKITHNPLFQKHADYVPGGLAKFAQQVANKPVSTARIYLSTVILAIIAFFTANMLYSGIRGGMIAVGRNPLSRKSIIKSLIQTVIGGMIVFAGGVFAVYLILKL